MNLSHIPTEALRAELIARGERDMILHESRALAVRIIRHMHPGMAQCAMEGRLLKYAVAARWEAIAITTGTGIAWTIEHAARVFSQTMGNIRTVRKRVAHDCQTNPDHAERLRKAMELFTTNQQELL